MKIFFRFLLISFIVLTVIAIFLFLQFDPNQYQSRIQDYLQKNLGLKARLGSLSLGWDMTPELRINRLALLDPATGRLVLDAQNLSFKVDFSVLLNHRRLLISSSSVDSAELFLMRKSGGYWLGDRGEVGNPETFILPNVVVRKALLHFLDESVSPSLAINLYQMDLKIEHDEDEAQVRISAEGSFSPKSMPNLEVQAVYSPEHHSLSFRLSYERGKLDLEGSVQFSKGIPYFDGKLEIHQLSLAEIIPEAWRSREHVIGSLSAQAEGKAQVTDFKAFQQTLSLKGIADIRRGALKNISLVGNVVRKIVTTAEGMQGLLSNMPPDWLPMIQSNDTRFDILQCSFELQEGRFTSDEVRLRHSEYLFSMKGTYGFLDHEANFTGRLVLLKNFSDYMIQKIKGLSGLQNQQGRMVIPFTFQGVLPEANIQPTIPYATSHFQS